MSDPLGYNPIGQSAPGLPRHDAGLPGHVSGQYTPISSSDFSSSPMPMGGGGYGAGRPLTAFESKFATWFARMIAVCTIYLLLPVQIVLYPIAGAVAAVAGGAVYLALGAGRVIGFDATMGWTWFVAFLAILPVMRIDVALAEKIPTYRMARHVLRVALVAAWFYYYNREDTPQTALIIAAIVGVMTHFLLRANLAKSLWHEFQKALWIRKD